MSAYTAESQEFHCQFFVRYISGALGQHPTTPISFGATKRKHDSFMTDDHTPIEMSWKWSPLHKTPVVRYSVDPARRNQDKFNTRATIELIKKILPFAGAVDLRWYERLVDMLTATAYGVEDRISHSDTKLPSSQQFLAFDLTKEKKITQTSSRNSKSSITLKTYFLPQWKALLNAESTFSLTRSSVHALSSTYSYPLLYESWGLIEDYIQSFNSNTNEGRPEVEIQAIDCIDPSQSRLKIYLRSSRTKFSHVIDVMTLGGRIPIIPHGEAIESLKSLWCAVLSLDPKNCDDDLPVSTHRTAGILYSVELRPGTSTPKIKVYIPAKHYGKNDLAVAQGLTKYLSGKGHSLADGSDYLAGVRQLCTHRKLEDGLGFHTYVSVALEDAGLDITTYFNPEIHHQSRRGKS